MQTGFFIMHLVDYLRYFADVPGKIKEGSTLSQGVKDKGGVKISVYFL
jgi:hemerythrin-like domain-containing protein